MGFIPSLPVHIECGMVAFPNRLFKLATITMGLALASFYPERVMNKGTHL